MRKALILMVVLLVAGLLFAATDKDKKQSVIQNQRTAMVSTQTANAVQATTTASQQQLRTQVRDRERLRVAFIDEDDDGINDLMRDDDGDGIPSCQDPD